MSICQWHHYSALIIRGIDVCATVPLHTAGIVRPFEFRVSWKPFIVESGKLLLVGSHSSLKMNLEPVTALDWEQRHTIRHVTSFI